LQENKLMMLQILILCLENFLTSFNLDMDIYLCVAALVSFVRVKKFMHTVSYPEDLNPLKHTYKHLISFTVQLLISLIIFGVCTVFVS